ncbi:glycoside hydrolase family 18 protein [Hymenobacter sp. J193]|uniref:glycoside hydrolase family 18 protein n=1 Tax=Hymenobacter sp. J193 TaxID=2898429 RepID=UPI002151DA92|nr:glycoside hydrolase family 18 protein [Hymenobacter sp. J193]MCR5887225.1 glycoside hydrolase family 18 protein [Hymenobacter sp. J193]
MRNILYLFALLLSMAACSPASTTAIVSEPDVAIIAYYAGDSTSFRQYPTTKLTHIIYSFLHLKGSALAFDKPQDRATVKALVALKAKNPGLKIMLSLGGWGGCETCSSVFSTEKGRTDFALSVKEILSATRTDGIDLDWEYPAIVGMPGHRFTPEDRHNFTLLIQALRKTLGQQYEISFAAGGFTEALQKSIEWAQVMPLVNRVNLMSYDLVNGYSTTTGHHTPLYSTPTQVESVDRGVRFLDSVGVAPGKIAIGAAFYARIFSEVPAANHGLNQACKFKTTANYKQFGDSLSARHGFVTYWDSLAQAPFAYSKSRKEFASFDDKRSVQLKTQYVLNKKLGGIMFWELTGDQPQNGLLDAISQVAHPTK